MRSLLENNGKDLQISGIGEIGLDYSHKNFQDPILQQVIFIEQMKLANEFAMPVVLHFRTDSAYKKGIDLLKSTLHPLTPIHVHCFTSTVETAYEIMTHFPNAKFGFTGVVTYQSASDVRKVVEKLPLEKIVLETDGPFFPMVRSRSVALPQDIPIVAEIIGNIKKKSLDHVLTQNMDNCKTIYSNVFKK